MLCQEPPHLRQFQRPDLAALDRGKINHAAQFGRWACQSPIPNGTLFGAKTPCTTPPVWPPCPSIENNVNSHLQSKLWLSITMSRESNHHQSAEQSQLSIRQIETHCAWTSVARDCSCEG